MIRHCRGYHLPTLAATALCFAPALLVAQDGVVPERADVLSPYSVAARSAWSALTPLADLARPTPHVPRVPSLLVIDVPAPVSLLTVAGVPSLMVSEGGRDGWGLAAGGAKAEGDYRRPLDPGRAGGAHFDGWGTERLGGHAVATGLLALESRRLSEDTRVATTAPYAGASLLIPTDTSSPIVERAGARLEGAVATRALGVDLGLATGFNGTSGNTQHSRQARLARRAVAGGTLSAARAIAGRAFVAAGWVRAQGGAETLTHLANPDPGRVFELQGYAETEPIDYSGGVTYYRHIARRTSGGGVGASGTIRRTRWAAYWERGSAHEEHSSARRNDPPYDAWDASGRTIGAAVQLGLGASGVEAEDAPFTLTLHMRDAVLDGDARRADLNGIIAFSSDGAFASGVELRWHPREALWTAVALGDLTRRTRRVYDAIAETGSNLTAWNSGGAFELRRDVATRGAVSVGYGASLYSANSLMPRAPTDGTMFHALVAPELEYAATPALSQRVTFGGRWRRANGSAFLISAAVERVGGHGELAQLATAPKGDRTAVSLVVGLIR